MKVGFGCKFTQPDFLQYQCDAAALEKTGWVN
jgi:hypothetical protein